MNSSRTFKAALAALFFAVVSVSASPAASAAQMVEIPELFHKNGSELAVRRVEGELNTFAIENSPCSAIANQPPCFYGALDICPDDSCSHDCTCFIYGGPTTSDGSCEPFNSGDYGCAPYPTNFGGVDNYAIANPYMAPNADIIVTRDQSCPPNGPNAVVASVHHDKGCLFIGKPEASYGVAIYVEGGAPFKK